MKPQRDKYNSNCWRCNGNVPMFGEITKLASYYAKLCADCLNDWELYATSRPVWVRMGELRVEAETLFAQTQHDGESRSAEVNKISDDLRARAVDALIAAREQPSKR